MSCIINSLCPWCVNTEEVDQPWAYNKTSQLEQDLRRGNSNIETTITGLNGVLFLPNRKHKIVSLIYLTMIKEDNALSPFTERQDKVFRVSAKTDTAASRCLTAGGVVSCTAGIVSCGAVGPGCYNQSWILETIGIIGNTIGSWASYASTGWYPHMASVKDNEKQNLYHDLEGVYEELGIRLVELSEESPLLANAIANRLQIGTICNVMKNLLSQDEATAIVKSLKKAKKFVTSGKIPYSPPAIHNCVGHVLLRREVETLREEVVRLKSFHPEVRRFVEVDLDDSADEGLPRVVMKHQDEK